MSYLKKRIVVTFLIKRETTISDVQSVVSEPERTSYLLLVEKSLTGTPEIIQQ
jgi:hypothetical protein